MSRNCIFYCKGNLKWLPSVINLFDQINFKTYILSVGMYDVLNGITENKFVKWV